MEAIMWLLRWIRDQLWLSLPDKGEGELSLRSKSTLDVIHVVNEVIMWAERSKCGDSGEILPVASIDRDAFYNVLTAAVSQSVSYLINWDDMSRDDVRKALHAHVIGLDTVAAMVLRPHYVSQIAMLATLVPTGAEGKSGGADHGSIGENDGGQRGDHSTGD